MKNLYKYMSISLGIISFALLTTFLPGIQGEAEAALSASTSMTIVNVAGQTYGGRITSVDVTQWSIEKDTGIKTGNWPSKPGLVPPTGVPKFSSPEKVTDIKLPTGKVELGSLWYEVYLYDAHLSGHGQEWLTIPNVTPWAGFPEAGGLNSMISNVYSVDEGETFWVHSWDYLAPDSSSKGGEGKWDDCFIGTMVHSFCEFSSTDCNGRYRTNLYFAVCDNCTKVPVADCWGDDIMN